MGDYFGHYLMAMDRLRWAREEADRQRLAALATRKRPAPKDFVVAGHARPTLPASSRTQ